MEAYADVVVVAGREEILRRLRARDVSFDPGRYAALALGHAWDALTAPSIAVVNAWSDQQPRVVVAYSTSRRVDIINFNFFDWDGEKIFNGGAERYVYDIAVLCRKLGLEPRLLQNARRPFTRDFHGVPVVGLKLTDRFDLASMSEAYEPHLAEAGLVVASPLDLAARLGPGRRIVGINHGIHWDHASNTLGQYSFERYRVIFDALQVTDVCVCVDTNFINWVRVHDWHLAQTLEYVPNYVDLATFKPTPKDFGAERIVVLYPRRLYRARGFEDTLQACEALFRRGLPIEVRLCGGADSRESALARGFVARHAPRARWDELGIHEMHRAYESSHIVLVPTNYSEGTSLSCIEAMATRNGIVATTVGGLPNLILDGFNGLLIKPGAHDLAPAIERLVEDRVAGPSCGQCRRRRAIVVPRTLGGPLDEYSA